MKALVIGYGSIGQRHARLLAAMGLEVAVVSRRHQDGVRVYATLDDGLREWRPGYVVIASRTSEHQRDLAALAGAGFAGIVLVEKPAMKQVSPMPENKFARAYVGYNIRFNPIVRRLKSLLSQVTVHTAHIMVGQYLPDWRPGSDYRVGYSAIRKEGGGVLRDLSHELDYANWLFGGWIHLTALGGSFSDLEIDSDDVFSVLLTTRFCPVVTVQMNYLDQPARREFLAQTDRGPVHADFIRATLNFNGETEYFQASVDQTYVAQHEAAISGHDETICTLNEGLDLVRMIDAAETASESRIWARV